MNYKRVISIHVWRRPYVHRTRAIVVVFLKNILRREVAEGLDRVESHRDCNVGVICCDSANGEGSRVERPDGDSPLILFDTAGHNLRTTATDLEH